MESNNKQTKIVQEHNRLIIKIIQKQIQSNKQTKNLINTVIFKKKSNLIKKKSNLIKKNQNNLITTKV